jgi:hypothetical protein
MGMMTSKPQPAVRGYKPQRKLYRLDFSETEDAGLEITARGTSMAGMLELMDMADGIEELEQLDLEKTPPAQVAERMRAMFAPFARILVAWNVIGDDDEPVPASLDGLMTQDPDFIGRVLTAYISAMTQAPPPLPAGSPSGATSPEGLTAAAALSRSLES